MLTLKTIKHMSFSDETNNRVCVHMYLQSKNEYAYLDLSMNIETAINCELRFILTSYTCIYTLQHFIGCIKEIVKVNI